MTDFAANKSSLLVLFLVVFIDLLGFAIVLPLLPIYADELLADDLYTKAQEGWIIGLLMASFSAVQFIFLPLWGRVSDVIGRRPVLLIGLAGSAVCYTGFGIATEYRSLTWIFLTRIGAGVAGATISTAQAYIADSTTAGRRASGMALIGAAFGLGFAFGPLIGAAGFIDFTGTISALSSGELTIQVTAAATRLSARVGYIAATLSGIALLIGIFKLPESLKRDLAQAEGHPRRKWLDLSALRNAIAVPSIAMLMLTSFVAVFSFANFESTLALLLAENSADANTARSDDPHDLVPIFLMFAYVGFVLTVAQGFLVRRLAKVVSEGKLAAAGAVISMAGFALLAWYSDGGGQALLLFALAVVVVGFAFLPPNLQSLISRRTDPAQQGGILGLGQSVSALARILGPLLGIRLFKSHSAYPYWAAMTLMVLAVLLVGVATRGGKDYVESNPKS